jgi:hypothetical protein
VRTLNGIDPQKVIPNLPGQIQMAVIGMLTVKTALEDGGCSIGPHPPVLKVPLSSDGFVLRANGTFSSKGHAILGRLIEMKWYSIYDPSSTESTFHVNCGGHLSNRSTGSSDCQ